MVSEPNALSQLLALFTPIHKDGYKFVGVAVAATVLAFLLSSTLGLLGVIATVALAFFFRDPVRVVPQRDSLVLGPADGIVISIESVTPPQEIGLGSDPMTRVSMFLSVLDVHVSRSPVSGRIESSVYQPGLHHNAAASVASRENERHAFAIETKSALRVGVVLVAGTVARRIVTEVKQGDWVSGGERIGIIRFGSRVDVYLPAAPSILVAEGQRIVAGETIIADFDSHDPPRAFRRI
jgi:phosphatidylserine decarboxylase